MSQTAKPAPAQPEPKTAASIPTAAVTCAGCGEPLVDIERGTGVALLRVYERSLLRPHRLTREDVPLAWTCNHCGTPTTIGL